MFKGRRMLYLIIFSIVVLISIIFFVMQTAVLLDDLKGERIRTSTRVTPTKTMTIQAVGLGDSLTKGVGYMEGGGYVGIVANRLEQQPYIKTVEVSNFGVRGAQTNHLLNVLEDEDVLQKVSQANVIFMSIGGNDMVEILKHEFLDLDVDDFYQERQTYERHLNHILSIIRRQNPSATIYFIGLYNPFEDYLGSANPTFKKIINRWNQSSKDILDLYQNTVFIETFSILHDNENLLYSDHFHPNRVGYVKIAKKVLNEFLNTNK